MAKGPVITFPRGEAVYPNLHRPDTKFHDLGAYTCNFRITKEEAEPFMAKLQEIAKEHTGKTMKKSENACWVFEEDDDGEETGMVLFKVSKKNRQSRKTGKVMDFQPLMIDAKKNDMPTDTAVWGGSIIKVQAEVYCWEYSGKKGVSLQPIMVQIIDLVTGGSRGDTSAFDEEEGYVSEAGGEDRKAFDDGDEDDSQGGDY